MANILHYSEAIPLGSHVGHYLFELVCGLSLDKAPANLRRGALPTQLRMKKKPHWKFMELLCLVMRSEERLLHDLPKVSCVLYADKYTASKNAFNSCFTVNSKHAKMTA